MATLILNGKAVANEWTAHSLNDGETPESVAIPTGKVLLPLAVWQVRKAEVAARAAEGTLGVWLNSDETADAISADLATLKVVGVNFPKFADGRGYSTARLLRQRYGFSGQLQAIGDVLPDQVFFYNRVGFDALALKDDKHLDAALAAFKTFPEVYQTAVDQPQPLFRRRVA